MSTGVIVGAWITAIILTPETEGGSLYCVMMGMAGEPAGAITAGGMTMGAYGGTAGMAAGAMKDARQAKQCGCTR